MSGGKTESEVYRKFTQRFVRRVNLADTAELAREAGLHNQAIRCWMTRVESDRRQMPARPEHSGLQWPVSFLSAAGQRAPQEGDPDPTPWNG
jgi:hypothetical protein